MSRVQGRWSPCWGAAPSRPALAGDEVHVWRAELRVPEPRVAELRGLLGPEEAARAERKKAVSERRRFIVARAALRQILSRYTGVSPAALTFRYAPAGKPELERGSRDDELRFNLSHAGDLALYAVTRRAPVGVDVERLDERIAAEEIARNHFTAAEARELERLPREERAPAFFRWWTRKEAYAKARGDGIGRHLSAFDASRLDALEAGEGEPLILDLRGERGGIQRWSLWGLAPAGSYLAAVAAPGAGWNLRCWDLWEPLDGATTDAF